MAISLQIEAQLSQSEKSVGTHNFQCGYPDSPH